MYFKKDQHCLVVSGWKCLQINLNKFTCADVKDRCMLLLPETNFIEEPVSTILPLLPLAHENYFVDFDVVNDNVRCNDEL